MGTVSLRYWFAGLAIALSVGAFAWLHGRAELTASQLKALDMAAPEATVFTEPVSVDWTGTVRRSLAGGRGFEIAGVRASSSLFFVYDIPDAVLPVFIDAGPVRVWGRWIGTTCEYGSCAPEVEVDRAEPLNAAASVSEPTGLVP